MTSNSTPDFSPRAVLIRLSRKIMFIYHCLSITYHAAAFRGHSKRTFAQDSGTLNVLLMSLLLPWNNNTNRNNM